MNALTVEDIFNKALELSDDSKESLAERLVAYLEAHCAPDVVPSHLAEAKRRRDEVRSGLVVPVDGKAVLEQARQFVGR